MSFEVTAAVKITYNLLHISHFGKMFKCYHHIRQLLSTQKFDDALCLIYSERYASDRAKAW